MRRIVIWLASTITIVVLLFGYHTSTNKSTSAATVPSASAVRRIVVLIDATAAYVQGRDAARWLQGRPIRSALVVWADGTTTRLATNPDQRPTPSYTN
jgi:hypothetical protein